MLGLSSSEAKANQEKYGLNETSIIPLLVKAIQELTARVNELENNK
jgi:hypothetical protein